MTKTIHGVQGRAEGMMRDELQALVEEQAEDEGLWFRVNTAPEAYLQQELRKLHAVIEARQPCHCGRISPMAVVHTSVVKIVVLPPEEEPHGD